MRVNTLATTIVVVVVVDVDDDDDQGQDHESFLSKCFLLLFLL